MEPNAEYILREMIESIHGLLREKKYNYVNYLLSVLDPTMDLSIACGFLTITLSWKEELPNRKLFYDRVLEKGILENAEQKTYTIEDVLTGLE